MSALKAYSTARNAFDTAEARLAKQLDLLEAVRGSRKPDQVTDARLKASMLEESAATAWEAMEAARAQYWRARAAEAQKALREMAPSLIAEASQCLIISGLPLAGVSPWDVARDCCLETPMPSIPDVDDMPQKPLISRVLERAERDVW
ncbi:MAG: hypothetical protein KBT88_12180 [Gammaproteobacteria bacterium]|nr:hypothetical protein [Gammaproteobacteria bacterium]MBQ0840533.1 hypothetical protein [Gammaproteobacteria bacterium]